MRAPRSMVAGIAVLFAVGAAFAQGPEGPPKPGPEHQKLSYYVGQWSGKGEMKAGPMGPGGPMTWTESCEWFAGNFAVVCKSEGTNPMGPMKGLGILGYNAEEKVYTYAGVDNMGYVGFSKGTVQGDTWTYTSDEVMGGKKIQGRFTLKQVSPTKMTFSWDMSEDGKTWTTMMTAESSKS